LSIPGTHVVNVRLTLPVDGAQAADELLLVDEVPEHAASAIAEAMATAAAAILVVVFMSLPSIFHV
jgi:hypothetical protein